jgi:hypothetical protein
MMSLLARADRALGVSAAQMGHRTSLAADGLSAKLAPEIDHIGSDQPQCACGSTAVSRPDPQSERIAPAIRSHFDKRCASGWLLSFAVLGGYVSIGARASCANPGAALTSAGPSPQSD